MPTSLFSSFALRQLKLANRIEEAKDEVLSSLEAAPNYKPAQRLLLELNVKQ